MEMLKLYKKERTYSPKTFAFDLSVEFKQIQKAFFNDADIYFTVKKVLQKGVLVQIGPFSSYVHRQFFFNKLPKNDMAYWKIISPNLLGKTFKGRIAFLNPDKFFIKIDSERNFFEPIPLKTNVPYEGVVVFIGNRNSFIFIDIGYHFNYRYGIHICYINSSSIYDKGKFVQLNAGDTYPVYFQGYDQSSKILLADTNFILSKDDDGTIGFFREAKQVSFVKMETDYFNKDLTYLFFELMEDGNRVKIISPIMQKYYGRDKVQIKDYFSNVEAGQEFSCRIVASNEKIRAYIGVVLLDWIDSQETPVVTGLDS